MNSISAATSERPAETDPELLEQAAKAIGMTLRYNYLGGRDANQPWDPINDDGDLYRLAQRLGISIDFHDCCAWKRLPSGALIQEYWGEGWGDEARAILRAAAEIGRAGAI